MTDLTARQAELLRFLVAFIEARGFPPTHREICEAMGFRSTHSASEALGVLQRKGRIQREPGKGRAIRIVEVG